MGVINQGRLIATGAPAELAGQLWRGEWIEIELGAPATRSLIDALSAIDGVLEANPDDRTLSIHLERVDRTPVVVSTIVGAGGDIYRVTPREHTLEDIYFELQNNGEARS